MSVDALSNMILLSLYNYSLYVFLLYDATVAEDLTQVRLNDLRFFLNLCFYRPNELRVHLPFNGSVVVFRSRFYNNRHGVRQFVIHNI